LEDEISRFPLYFNGPSPFECTVKAGEILYLYDSLLFLCIMYLFFLIFLLLNDILNILFTCKKKMMQHCSAHSPGFYAIANSYHSVIP
jgi:hypothetical protein